MYLKDKRERKFVEVRKLLLKGIISGDYTGKLPGERQLAQMAGCSYMTLRRAICSLVDDGYLHKVIRKGTFIIQSDYDSSTLHSIGIYISENYLSDRYDNESLLSKMMDNCRLKKIACSIIGDLDTVHHSDYDIIVMMYPRADDLKHLEMKFPHDRIISLEERNDLNNTPSVASDTVNAASASVKFAEENGISELVFLSDTLMKNKYVKRCEGFKLACNKYSVRYNEIIYSEVISLSKLEEIVADYSAKTMFVCNSQTDVDNLKIIARKMNLEENYIICGYNCFPDHGIITIEENNAQIVSEALNAGFQLIKGNYPGKKVVVAHVKYVTGTIV